MTFNCRSYIDALSARFNECIARHMKCHSIPVYEGRTPMLPEAILPPSSGHAEESAVHQTAFSYAAPRCTCSDPSGYFKMLVIEIMAVGRYGG